MSRVHLRVLLLALMAAALGGACSDDALGGLPRPETCAPGVDGCGGTIDGRVCDVRTGTWRHGVHVWIDLPTGPLSTETDVAGYYRLVGVPAGAHYLNLEGGDYSHVLPVAVMDGESVTLGYEVCEQAPGSLRGRVCDPVAGAWVADAEVRLDDSSGTSSVTDPLGRFSFSALPPRTYQLRISTADGFYQTRTAAVSTGSMTDLGPERCDGSFGGVKGRVCGGDGYWLTGAVVSVTLDGGLTLETFTDGEGYFLLTGVPAGAHTLVIQSGSFETTYDVVVAGEEIFEVAEPVCIPRDTRMAVVTGLYDSVEDVLTDLGYGIRQRFQGSTSTLVDPAGTIDIVDGGDVSWIEDFLGDGTWLGTYDILFLNCGLSDEAIYSGATSTVVAALANLTDFVDGGGSLYASDWASDVLRTAFPGRINFLGNDAMFGEARKGVATSSQTGTVVDLGLASNLGTAIVTLNLNLPQWVVLATQSSQPSNLKVLVKGDVSHQSGFLGLGTTAVDDSPLVVRFDYGSGRVIFTSAHNESQTTADLRDVLNFIVFNL